MPRSPFCDYKGQTAHNGCSGRIFEHRIISGEAVCPYLGRSPKGDYKGQASANRELSCKNARGLSHLGDEACPYLGRSPKGDYIMIKLVDVHKRFGDQKVLDGVSLAIPKGMITVIIGASGVGKSVLLKHMIGLLQPERGKVYVDDVDLSRLSPPELVEIRKKFGMLFQGAALFDSLTVFENVAFPLVEHTRLTKKEIEERVEEKLHLVGLSGVGSKMPSELSGGMKKRVGLARAIVLQPEVILYDEPTTGLDPIMTDSVDNLILDMQQKLKVTSVVISHDIVSAFDIADQIAMLSGGRIIESGRPEDFRGSKNPVVRKFIGD